MSSWLLRKSNQSNDAQHHSGVIMDQALVFRQLRSRLLRNGLRTMMETGKVRFYTILGTSGFVAAIVFALSLVGFYELHSYRIPGKGVIVAGLFDLMFFTLGVMLLFSTGIILYASLFTAPETRFLLTTPARADHIFAAKFQDAVSFSSWGFVVLGLPILIAYGIIAKVPFVYYALLPLFLLGFVLLPGAASACICLLFMRFTPRNRKQTLIILGLVAAAIICIWGYRLRAVTRDAMRVNNRDALDAFVGQFDLARSAIAPSHWMASGIMSAARGEAWHEILTPLALIWSNGLMMFVLATWLARRLYRTAYDRTVGAGDRNKTYRGNILDRLMEFLVFYLDKPTRILVVKDFRTFRRDPSQWALIAIFGGLIFLGVRNFRQYINADLEGMDKYIVGIVNLAGISILLCAGLSRFIFPLISLEGRKFWILGLLPISRRQILVGKFAFAATGTVVIGLSLVVGSELLLQLPIGGIIIHTVAIVSIALGLSGLNVGLGAYMPNFRETDPSKIVAGFSGTVNMVIGLGYVIISLALMALPMHIAAVLRRFKRIEFDDLPWWTYAGLPLGVALAVCAVVVPLRAGAKAMRETEF
jgi:ABC-2 type transport system permease protein